MGYVSYSRFTDSDVFVYYHVNGYLTCALCSLDENRQSKNFFSTTHMSEHLKIHEFFGDNVPSGIYRELLEDDRENFPR